MTTILIIKNDIEKLALPNATIKADGTIWSAGGVPLVNADLLDQPGGITKAAAIAASKAADYATLEGVVMHTGDNGSGKIALVGAEVAAWRDAQADKRQAEAAKAAAEINALIPGIEELRAARAGEADDYEAMSDAIERGDGYFPANRYKCRSADDLAEAYPDAARWLRAEGYSYASHIDKSSAGDAAMRAMRAGTNPTAAIAKMEADWSADAARCVANS